MEPRHIVPAGREWLAFSCSMPSGWLAVEIPTEEPDFSDPAKMLPLSIWTATYGLAVFSVAARPAFDSGAVAQWAEWLASQEEIRLTQRNPVTINGAPGLLYDAEQQSEAGPLRMRLLVIEDGSRFYLITALAHAQLWESLESTFTSTFNSFQLDTLQGPTRPITVMPVVESALADNASTLDPEHETNVRLRDNGAGFTPRILEINMEQRYARLGASALASTIDVPLGWHVIDDGRRTLMFDPDGRMQLNFDLRPDPGHQPFLQSLLADYQAQQPGIPHVQFDAAGMPALAFRGLSVNGESLDQCFLLRSDVHPGRLLVARVTAAEADMSCAMDAAGFVMASAGVHV